MRAGKDNIMNRYSLEIEWKTGVVSYEKWEFIVISNESKEVVREIIKNYQENNNVEFESPVKLMDAICEAYDWQWEDFFHDIEIRL